MWKTDRMAAKDAAFEACIALYKAGLLNGNFLPLRQGDDFHVAEPAKHLSSMVEIQEQHNPWLELAKVRSIADNCYLKVIKVRVLGEVVLSTKLILPIFTCSLPWSPLLFKDNAHYEISMEHSTMATEADRTDFDLFQTTTRLFLRPVYGSWIDDDHNPFGAFFAPPIAHQKLRAWIQQYSYGIHKDSAKGRMRSTESPGSISVSQMTEVTNVTQLLYNPNRFALFASHIMHRLESLFLGHKMIERLHPSVCLERVDLVVEAISSPSASGLPSNNRLAFLGDTVLDFLITGQLFVRHSNWHEGYLSAKKKLIISNTHLSSMAFQTGLDRFVITKPFNERTWKLPKITEILTRENGGTRIVSEETLADVVEALIGAAYLEGSFEKALQCARFFLPEVISHPARPLNSSLTLAYNQDESPGIPHFLSFEKLIGYKFRNKALSVEAMTHPSYEQDLAIGSYGRLAFLGSSILSMTILESLWHGEKTIPNNQLNLLRATAINKGFLAFVCTETSLDMDYADVQQSFPFHKVRRQRSISLWAFMRHGHPDIASEREEFLKKHLGTCQRIRNALATWATYPWKDLAKLEATGYFSDIVRSLFGAVYIDSGGDMFQCSQLAEKLNILPRLRRLMQDNVEIMHPKTRLGELAGNRSVAYFPDTLSANTYSCIVRVDGQQIGEAQNGSCKQEAVIKAAEHAIMILSNHEMSPTINIVPG
jgi:dsRNA-specific ribonuclease